MGEREIIRTTCTRDCYDSCGLAVVREDGRVRKVLGDPDHPVSRGALCGKCAIAYNGAWRDPQRRLSHPMKRSGPKGSGTFEAISWDQALTEIAATVNSTLAGPGGETILNAHYTGTCSQLAGHFPDRFFNAIGATEVDPDTICNNAGHVALDYVLGASARGFDPRTAKDSHCILVWGANPSASAPHAHRHWLKDTPAKVVVVDPICHDTAREADLHLQLRPGSDAALAFGLLHILQRDSHLDEAFIAQHTLGWDAVLPAVEAATPEQTAALTAVPREKLEAAAALYGAGPALLWLGQGLQRQPQGGNVMRACCLLPAATGNFGKPGAGLCYLNGGASRGIDGRYVSAPQLRKGPARSMSHMDLVDALEDSSAAQMFFCWNMNVAASAPRQAALAKALAREDLTSVVIDLFMTDTARLADYVLPAASFLEFDDLMVPYFHLALSAQVKADEAPGEALPNQEIFRRLARAVGLEDPALYEADRAVLDHLLATSGCDLDFEALAKRGTVPVSTEPVEPFPDLTFPTPSGRIEIASARAEADGLPRVPMAEADPLPAAGKLRLLSPASRWLMNDSYGNDETIQGKLGAASVGLNPEDAASRGIVEGAEVRLSNETGSLVLQAELMADLLPGTALAHKGRWPGCETKGANVNLLNPGLKSDMGESTAVHGVEVSVTPL